VPEDLEVVAAVLMIRPSRVTLIFTPLPNTGMPERLWVHDVWCVPSIET
jgi:hypothetical protein